MTTNAENVQTQRHRNGQLAKEYCGVNLTIRVLRSAAGYYIGTADEEGPVSRESAEYWSGQEAAEQALEKDDWTQRQTP